MKIILRADQNPCRDVPNTARAEINYQQSTYVETRHVASLHLKFPAQILNLRSIGDVPLERLYIHIHTSIKQRPQ